MGELQEAHRVGLDHVGEVTTLLQRVRGTHPTAGLYEAADLQWWWSQRPRPTDSVPQLFWFDQDGRPEAAVVATDFGDGVQLAPLVLPGAAADRVAHVIERGLAHASECGIDDALVEVDIDDQVLGEVLAGRGFAIKEDGVVETWMDAAARPRISRFVADRQTVVFAGRTSGGRPAPD